MFQNAWEEADDDFDPGPTPPVTPEHFNRAPEDFEEAFFTPRGMNDYYQSLLKDDDCPDSPVQEESSDAVGLLNVEPGSSSADPAQPPNSKKRLSGKRSPDGSLTPWLPVKQEDGADEEPDEVPDEEQGSSQHQHASSQQPDAPAPTTKKSFNAHEREFRVRARDEYLKDWIANKNNQEGYFKQGTTYRMKRDFAMAYWTKLDQAIKEAHIQSYFSKHQGEAAAAENGESQQEQVDRTGTQKMIRNARTGHKLKGFQLTWNFKCFEDGRIIKWHKELQSLDPTLTRFKQVENCIRNFPYVVTQWKDFEKELMEIYKAVEGVTELSYCQEISIEGDPGRIHFHATISSLKGAGLEHSSNEVWAIFDVKPHVDICTARGAHTYYSMNRAHAYQQIPKIGHLRHSTNYQIIKHFALEQKWLMNWWRMRKISHDVCERMLCEARGHTDSCVREVQYICEKDQENKARELQRKYMKMIESSRKQFRSYPDIEEWRKQYDESNKGVVTRFKFLVLVGDSEKGKSSLAKSLFGVENTFYCNCQNVCEPNLKGLRSDHRAILFDEATPEMVVNNKVLFQATVDGAFLAQSRCLRDFYWRFTYGIAMIICTNKWIPSTAEEIGEDPEAEDDPDQECERRRKRKKTDTQVENDRAWLNMNGVVVTLEQKVYLAD